MDQIKLNPTAMPEWLSKEFPRPYSPCNRRDFLKHPIVIELIKRQDSYCLEYFNQQKL